VGIAAQRLHADNPRNRLSADFTRDGVEIYSHIEANAELVADDGAVNDQFATSVAISGNTVVAGSPNAPIGSNLNQGAAYVFGR
jgi:hypothetical protein